MSLSTRAQDARTPTTDALAAICHHSPAACAAGTALTSSGSAGKLISFSFIHCPVSFTAASSASATVRLAALTQHLRWQHADAMRHFTACIALVAQCEVYFKQPQRGARGGGGRLGGGGGRSAHHAAQASSRAGSSAGRATAPPPCSWESSQALARAGSLLLLRCALFCLCARLSALVAAPDAKEAYAQAAELEPDNASYHAVRRRAACKKLASA